MLILLDLHLSISCFWSYCKWYWFSISASECSLLVCENTVDSWLLTLPPATSLNSLFSSKGFLVCRWEWFYFFFSNLDDFYFFLPYYAGENVQYDVPRQWWKWTSLVSFSVLGEELQSFTLKCSATCRFFTNTLFQVGDVSFHSLVSESLYHNWKMNFSQMPFQHWYDHVFFPPWTIDMMG